MTRNHIDIIRSAVHAAQDGYNARRATAEHVSEDDMIDAIMALGNYWLAADTDREENLRSVVIARKVSP